MKLSDKIADIKKKVRHLASKMDKLRSENKVLIEENRELRIKLQRDAKELKFMRHQLAVFKERLMNQSLKEVIEEEE